MEIESGDVVVITGAGGGIGSALAKRFALDGCALALSDISGKSLEKLRSELPAMAGKVTTHQVNVTDKEQMRGFAETVQSEHGKANILINNAGITLQKNFSTHSLEDWERIVGINQWGVIYGCHFFEAMLRRQPGKAHIVNLSSMAAFAGFPAQSSYCGTKAFVEKLSACIWAEFQPDGIGVTHVHPGAIKTDMILATLEDSDDIEAARRNYKMVQKMAVPPEKAAEKIFQAVRKNKKKIRIGKDAFILDYLSRFAPGLTNLAMVKVAAKQAKDASQKKISA